MNVKETKKNIIQAGRIAVKELIKVAKEPIIDFGPDISADRLKNAAATKKLAIFDAFDILSKIDQEQENISSINTEDKTSTKQGLQKDALNNLYQKLEDYIPKAVLAKKNKARTWLYGYNEKYDVVVISRSGEIKDVININGLCIALPKPLSLIHI